MLTSLNLSTFLKYMLLLVHTFWSTASSAAWMMNWMRSSFCRRLAADCSWAWKIGTSPRATMQKYCFIANVRTV